MKIKKKELIQIVIFSLILIFSAFVLYKKMRGLFPPPQIGSEKLVGFAQYFGYPIYFDTIFFFLIVSIPLIVTIILKIRK